MDAKDGGGNYLTLNNVPLVDIPKQNHQLFLIRLIVFLIGSIWECTISLQTV